VRKICLYSNIYNTSRYYRGIDGTEATAAIFEIGFLDIIDKRFLFSLTYLIKLNKLLLNFFNLAIDFYPIVC
jgi:hypothetical protein